MARKKKSSAQQKRQQVTDPSGWTHIVKGPQSNMASISIPPFQRLETSFTVEDYSNQFQKLYTTHCQASPCMSSLKSVFEQDILTAERIILTKCVCLGLGSLTMGTPDSSYQLAALITMLEILSMHSDTPSTSTGLPCSSKLVLTQNVGVKFDIQEVIFQDPAFNARDKTFLTSHGYAVLEHPEAFSKVDDNTFLFAPHLEVGVLATALEHGTPAVCISNNMTYYFDG